MNNWMEEFERNKDEQRERELNIKLEKLLDLLDKVSMDNEEVKILKEILNIYEELRTEAFDYDEKDYNNNKKKKLKEFIYKIKNQKHMETLESQSWNEYKDEEQKQEEEWEL